MRTVIAPAYPRYAGVRTEAALREHAVKKGGITSSPRPFMDVGFFIGKNSCASHLCAHLLAKAIKDLRAHAGLFAKLYVQRGYSHD